MVCSADDLLEWKDFPKGLRVLLLEEDSHSSAEIKSKLEQMDYIVSTFHNVDEALNAISNKCDQSCFHVAIVEVSTGNSLGSLKFLETAKDLPTIMTSNNHCLNTMMKCIALGAAEFLQKPLSEDKLRNIWQHAVHKAFNAGEDTLSKSMKPVKETVVSMLHLQLENSTSTSSTNQNDDENLNLLEAGVVNIEASNSNIIANYHECEHDEETTVNDKFPAPSTPQLKQGDRLMDDIGDQFHQDQPNTSSLIEKNRDEQDEEHTNKFVDNTTCNNSSVVQVIITTTSTSSSNLVDDALIKKENSSPHDDASINITTTTTTTTERNLSSSSSQPKNKGSIVDSNVEPCTRKKQSLHPKSCGNRGNRKKMKVDWTPDLHKRFVQAVEQLGVDQAIPSRILELMKTEGLTRHNVASHLQKYRLNKRHIVPKQDHHHHQDRTRWQSSSSMQTTNPNYHHHHQYQYKPPIMAYPPPYQYHPHHQVYHVWGHPAATTNHHPSTTFQMWGHQTGFPMWQHPADSRIWKGTTTTTYPAATGVLHDQNKHVDHGWGCPVNVMPPLSNQVPCATYPQVQNVSGYDQCLDANIEDSSSMGNMMMSSFHLYPQDDDDDDDNNEKEMIDKIVKEAMTKPWLPLPLGLNPPSTESVLSELQRQGIPNIPPPHHHF